MSGHSKFKNIIHRKEAQDKKKSQLFTRLVKEIIVAVRAGMPDPNLNPRLRTAITSAKQANLPKNRINNAIKKATSTTEIINYEEIQYEGYGPGGVAIIVETLTDNKNRTANEIKAVFHKNGGVLGAQGSVEYMFKKVGSIVYEKNNINKNSVIDAAIELEADDCIDDNQTIEILSNINKYSDISDNLEQKFGKPTKAGIKWSTDTKIELTEEKSKQIVKLLLALDNIADVQLVNSNHTLVMNVNCG